MPSRRMIPARATTAITFTTEKMAFSAATRMAWRSPVKTLSWRTNTAHRAQATTSPAAIQGWAVTNRNWLDRAGAMAMKPTPRTHATAAAVT